MLMRDRKGADPDEWRVEQKWGVAEVRETGNHNQDINYVRKHLFSIKEKNIN